MNAAAVGAPVGVRGLIERLDDLLGRPVSMRSLALLRVLTGPVVLLHLRPFLSDSLDGRTYQDAFYEPYAAWYPELPEAMYIGLLWLAAVAAVSMSLGFLTRLATATTFATTTARTSSSSSGCWPWRRAGGSCPWTPGPAAYAGDRRSTAKPRPGPCGCSGSSAPPSTERPA